MKTVNKLQCDVLILGGGIGGLACAASLKEHNPELDVLVVEKNFAGYSGKANRGGGVLQYFDLNRIDPAEFAVFHANAIGAFLGDQELMMKYVSMNTEMLDKLASWGVNLPKNEDGSYHVMPTGPMTAMICVDLDITLKVRKYAEKEGVRFIDKTALAELYKDGERISGALVYSILDGELTLINAKRVVLATGSQNYRIGSMWSSGRGDGIAAAYRAGAAMRNAEFGNFAQLVKVKSHNEIVFGENFMYNAKNEFITKNFREFRETDINSNAIREWYTQMRDGNGPIHLDYGPQNAEEGSLERLWNRPYGYKFRMLNDTNGNAVDTDLEVCPMFIGEQSPIMVGHDMQTTIPGLYAVGDCCYSGSGLAGAVPAPPGRNRGSGILNAVFDALVCAEAIGTQKVEASFGSISDAAVEKDVTTLFAPLDKAEGASPIKVIEFIQKAMAPVEQSVWMHKERMEKAMGFVNEAKKLAPQMKAKDWHELLSCREAEAMVLSAEMHYKASEMRKESRGWFLREDYPEMDNANWLKWIIVENKGGEMTLSTKDIPIAGWPAQPHN
jgi:succinate dehydrogenase/fumarate reductase flavoprotein subunit